VDAMYIRPRCYSGCNVSFLLLLLLDDQNVDILKWWWWTRFLGTIVRCNGRKFCYVVLHCWVLGKIMIMGLWNGILVN